MDQVSKLKTFAANWSSQLTFGMTIGRLCAPLAKNRNTLVFAGMGGSILGAEVLRDLFPRPDASVTVWETDGLPPMDRHALVVCASYSGSTKETLSAFRAAHARRIPTIAIGHGGKLKELARQSHVPYLDLPSSPTPRLAVAYFLGAFLGIAGYPEPGHCIPLPRSSREETDITRFLKPAQELLIAAPTHLASLGHLWEIVVGETAKMPTFLELLPDAQHHVIASFSRMKNHNQRFRALFILDTAGPHVLALRARAMARVFTTQLKIPSRIIVISSKRAIECFGHTFVTAHNVSLNLARLRRIDPLETEIQDAFKRATP
jgi:hypothetical protein